jgi:hypothetical protein
MLTKRSQMEPSTEPTTTGGGEQVPGNHRLLKRQRAFIMQQQKHTYAINYTSTGTNNNTQALMTITRPGFINRIDIDIGSASAGQRTWFAVIITKDGNAPNQLDITNTNVFYEPNEYLLVSGCFSTNDGKRIIYIPREQIPIKSGDAVYFTSKVASGTPIIQGLVELHLLY